MAIGRSAGDGVRLEGSPAPLTDRDSGPELSGVDHPSTVVSLWQWVVTPGVSRGSQLYSHHLSSCHSSSPAAPRAAALEMIQRQGRQIVQSRLNLDDSSPGFTPSG